MPVLSSAEPTTIERHWARLLSLQSRMATHVTTTLLPVPFKGRMLADVRLSDHSLFRDQGFNTLLVTDALDRPFLMAVIDGLEAAIGELG